MEHKHRKNIVHYVSHCHTENFSGRTEEEKKKIEIECWAKERNEACGKYENIMRECEAKFCLMNFYLFDKHRKTPLKRENSKALRYVTLGYFSSRFNTTGLAIFFCPQQRNLINTKINQWSEKFFCSTSHFIYHRVLFDNLN